MFPELHLSRYVDIPIGKDWTVPSPLGQGPEIHPSGAAGPAETEGSLIGISALGKRVLSGLL